MGFRVTISGVTIECDSPQEALSIARANEGLPTKQPTRQRRVDPSAAVLSDTPKQFLYYLKEAHPKALDVESLAERLGKTPKSLPPIILGIRNWLRKISVDFESVVARKTEFEKGKPVTTYSITEAGIELLQKQFSEARTPHSQLRL